MLWQKRIIRRIYRTNKAGKRVVRTGLLSMGRKNGKTSLASAIALVHLSGPEAIQGGQVLSAAADRPQAAIVFGQMMEMALANEHLAKRITFRTFNKTAEDIVNGSTYAALSSDAKKAHGLSPSLWIGDEVSQWRGRDLLSALQSGMGAHSEPLGLVISTRSPNPNNPLEELIAYAAKIDAGAVKDTSFEAWVYSAPPESDPWSLDAWKAANPALGKFRSLKDIEVQAHQAQAIPSMEPAFRAYCLNQPVSTDDRWIGPADWEACAGDAEARGEVWGGLDLAGGASDLTCFSLYWPATGRLVVKGFIPADLLDAKERTDEAPYRLWASQGHIIPVPGRTVDRGWLAGWIKHEVDALDLQGIATDRWMIDDLRSQFDKADIDLPLEPIGAGFQSMNPALLAFEALVLTGKLAHGGNPLLRWCAANATIDTDSGANRKISKMRSRGRIDAAVSAVFAVGLASRETSKLITFGEGDLVISF